MDAKTNDKCELYRAMQAVVKFYCLKRNIMTKTFEKMKSVFGDGCLSQMQVFALRKEFSEGRETAELRISQCRGQTPMLFTPILMLTL